MEHEDPSLRGARAGEPPPWPRLSSRDGPDLLICRVRLDRMRNPRNGRVLERTVLETPDWVNVVALTAERRLVCVQQFRFGTGSVTTEIPGGVVDAGEQHAAAARRELAEETGYEAERWRYLGAVEPNPAFHTNRCHHWLAEGARAVFELELDEGEDIRVLTLDLAGVRAEIAAGRMRHALVLTALAQVFDLRSPEQPQERRDAGGATP